MAFEGGQRDPISGAILLENAGVATGVYGNPPGPPIVTPIFTTLPAFDESPPTIIGSVVNMTAGVTIPPLANVTIRLGFYAGSVFTGPFIPAGGTIPPEWAGKEYVAECVVTNRHLVTVEYVESNVIVEAVPSGDGFPDYATYELFGAIPAEGGDWFVSEIRTGSTAGRRRYTVEADAVVSAGFTLRIASSGLSGVDFVPTDSTTSAIAPGDILESSGSLPTGTVCYNNLYWRRASDGAYKRAHQTVNPITFTMLGLSNPVDPPPSLPNLNPNIEFSSWDTAISYARTHPNLCSSGDFVIQVSGSQGGGVNLTSINNSYGGIDHNRLIFRGTGNYTDNGCSQVHTGLVNMSNSHGVHLAMLHLRTNRAEGFIADDSSDCGAVMCLVERAALNVNVNPPLSHNVVIKRANGFTFDHCVSRYSGGTVFILSNNRNARVRGCAWDYTTEDDVKFWGNNYDTQYERNWATQRIMPNPGDAHEDHVQAEGYVHVNERLYGNVDLNPHVGLAARQTFWAAMTVATHNYTGSRVEQNISFISSNFLRCGTSTGNGLGTRYNTVMQARDPNQTAPQIDAQYGPRDYNFTQGGPGLVQYAGPNGLIVNCGNVGARNYAAIAPYFRYGIPWQSSAGVVVPKSQQLLKAWEPATGQRPHWSHPNPVGAYIRSREIFGALSFRNAQTLAWGCPVMPFGWPVLGVVQKTINHDNYVVMGYTTGNYHPVTGLPI